MFKNKLLINIFAAIFLVICSNNITFALDEIKSETIYPDLNYEFTGKDPCEKFNRKMFVFNLKLNKYILRPANIVWASVMPKYGMDRVKSAYNNINYPVRLMGCLLQRDFKASGQETLRFLINTTIGAGGLYDPAKSKFKLEPCQEDLEQVLAKYIKKQGPYLVLPVVQGNLRDLFGKAVACPLRPTAYAGPFGAAANVLFAINNTTYLQPLFKKVDESYADPYIIAKQADGIAKYIKLNNLDRKEVFSEKTKSQNIINISKTYEEPIVKPDIELEGYNSQDPFIDSLRTSFFDNQKLGKSIWAEMSVWNRTFNKKLKKSSVRVFPKQKKYKFKYILQKNKTSPLAILYPSIGEGITAEKSVVLSKILYKQGYSVIIQGSAFNWEFVKSMPEGYKPGIPAQDAQYLRLATAKIINKLEQKKGYKFGKRILVGCSFGALTGLFTAAQEENENTLNISKYITINPPVEILSSMKMLDKYCSDWKKNPTDIKMQTAIAAEKIVQVYNKINKQDLDKMPEKLPFTSDEAKLAIGFVMKQKLYDTVFAIENCTRCKKSGLETTVNKMSFTDYAQKYLNINETNYDKANYETSLYSLGNFLRKSKKYKIYHSLDDYFVSQNQLFQLKNYSKDKLVLFSNGSHLGEMYRNEFLEQFKKDIDLQNLQNNENNNEIDDNIKLINTELRAKADLNQEIKEELPSQQQEVDNTVDTVINNNEEAVSSAVCE